MVLCFSIWSSLCWFLFFFLSPFVIVTIFFLISSLNQNIVFIFFMSILILIFLNFFGPITKLIFPFIFTLQSNIVFVFVFQYWSYYFNCCLFLIFLCNFFFQFYSSIFDWLRIGLPVFSRLSASSLMIRITGLKS